MTDFDKKAREILGSAQFKDRGGVPAIAAALKAAYNAGIEDACVDFEYLEGTDYNVRAKKRPT